MAPHGDPLAELVLTVLSQSTNDRNRDVAYLRLRARLPTWEEVRDAPREVVEEAIRPGGISKVKSGRIQRILHAISDERSEIGGTHCPKGRVSKSWVWIGWVSRQSNSRSTGWRRSRWVRRATT